MTRSHSIGRGKEPSGWLPKFINSVFWSQPSNIMNLQFPELHPIQWRSHIYSLSYRARCVTRRRQRACNKIRWIISFDSAIRFSIIFPYLKTLRSSRSGPNINIASFIQRSVHDTILITPSPHTSFSGDMETLFISFWWNSQGSNSRFWSHDTGSWFSLLATWNCPNSSLLHTYRALKRPCFSITSIWWREIQSVHYIHSKARKTIQNLRHSLMSHDENSNSNPAVVYPTYAFQQCMNLKI